LVEVSIHIYIFTAVLNTKLHQTPYGSSYPYRITGD